MPSTLRSVHLGSSEVRRGRRAEPRDGGRSLQLGRLLPLPQHARAEDRRGHELLRGEDVRGRGRERDELQVLGRADPERRERVTGAPFESTPCATTKVGVRGVM